MWQSRCLQSGLVSLTHACLRPCWVTWGWTRPAGAACCRNKPLSPRRRSPALLAPTRKTLLPKEKATQLQEEPAPKKYLREAENPDTPRVPFHLKLLIHGPWPKGLTTHWLVGHPAVCSFAAAPSDANILFMLLILPLILINHWFYLIYLIFNYFFGIEQYIDTSFGYCCIFFYLLYLFVHCSFGITDWKHHFCELYKGKAV